MYGYGMNMNNMMPNMGNMGGMMPPPPMGDMPAPAVPTSSSNDEADKNKGRYQTSPGSTQGPPGIFAIFVKEYIFTSIYIGTCIYVVTCTMYLYLHIYVCIFIFTYESNCNFFL